MLVILLRTPIRCLWNLIHLEYAVCLSEPVMSWLMQSGIDRAFMAREGKPPLQGPEAGGALAPGVVQHTGHIMKCRGMAVANFWQAGAAGPAPGANQGRYQCHILTRSTHYDCLKARVKACQRWPT